MGCDLWQARLDAYVDGELPATEASELDAHLRACPLCAADTSRRTQWKRLTQLSGKRFSADAQFRRRIQRNIAARKRSVWVWRWAPQLAMAAAIAVAAFLLVDHWFTPQRSDAFGEIVDLHVSALASANLVDVVSSDRHTVKPWFAGKLPFSFDLPETSGTGFELIGGRMAYLNQEPAAELIYAARKHRVSVFILVDRPELSRRFGSGTFGGLSFHIETWSAGGLRYFVIGDVSPDEIRRLAGLFKPKHFEIERR